MSPVGYVAPPVTFRPGRVLVTGGAGFIGSHLCERLVAEGREVVAFDSFDRFYDPRFKEQNLRGLLAGPRFRLERGDLCDPARVGEVLAAARPEVVVHLAALAGVRPSIREPERYARVNVEGTIGLLEACRRLGIKRVVFASSSSVYGARSAVPFREDDRADTPASPYAATKRAGELIAFNYHHLYGFDITSLRFFTVYGPRQRPEMAIHKFIRQIARGEKVALYGDGSSSRDYTFIDDIIDGVVASLDRLDGCRIYNLGESHPIALSSLVEKIARLVGREPRIEHHPDQPGDVPRTYADVSRARAELGYEPRVHLDEGLRRAVGWWQELCGPGGPLADAQV